MKNILKSLRYLVLSFLALVLVSVGIDASDNSGSSNNSVLGKLLFNKDDGPCPMNMVLVPFEGGDFCIDKYEASPSGDCSYAEPSNQIETRVNLDMATCKAVSKEAVIPWRNISRDQASRACAKAGKRLATNSEWLHAAQGTPDLKSNWGAEDCQVSNNWTKQPGMTGEGGSCSSSFGAYDMVGNVWEWVSGTVIEGKLNGVELPSSGYIKSTNGEGLPLSTDTQDPDENYNQDYFWIKPSGPRGMVRGGYWNNKSEAGVYSLYVVIPPDSVESGVGFRCVK